MARAARDMSSSRIVGKKVVSPVMKEWYDNGTLPWVYAALNEWKFFAKLNKDVKQFEASAMACGQPPTVSHLVSDVIEGTDCRLIEVHPCLAAGIPIFRAGPAP